MPKPLFDPLAVPVDFAASEPALAGERLDGAWLRERLANQPPWTVEDDDERHWRQIAQPQPIRNAAVLIAIVLRETGPTLLLTQRNPDLTDHPGQISFPGGRVEESDASPDETALRETEEEIGLARQHIEIIGRLPEYRTGTGYNVTPVVGLVMPPFELQPDVREVAEVFEVPLAFLMDGVHHQRHTVRLPGQTARRHFYSMPYRDYFIWGATAAMIRNLFHLLRA
ncbi:CoA pyrophosphatase [Oxalobacteraceae bacterium CAVE-383]|nr:CoA pyrophosphatase [Oxalobacteraceae bacterium CAVE-383]